MYWRFELRNEEFGAVGDVTGALDAKLAVTPLRPMVNVPLPSVAVAKKSGANRVVAVAARLGADSYRVVGGDRAAVFGERCRCYLRRRRIRQRLSWCEVRLGRRPHSHQSGAPRALYIGRRLIRGAEAAAPTPSARR